MAPKDDEQVQDKTQNKSKMKLFLIIGIAVATAVAVTLGVVKFTGGSKAESHKEEKAKAETTTVYSLDPFIVNIYDGQELRYLKLKVEMELSDEEAKSGLMARQAQIRDSILVMLTTKTLQDLQYLQGKNQLKQEIMAAVSKIVPSGKLRQIYFTDFVVQ